MPYPSSSAFNPASFHRRVRDLAYPQYFIVSFPSVFNDTETLSLLATSTTLPPRSIESYAVPVQGLDVKMAGKITFADWSVEFRAERLHRIRNTFLKWSEMIVQATTMRRSLPVNYMKDDVQVAQLDTNGRIYTSIKFTNLWPREVSEIKLGHGENPPEEFSVTFAFTSWQLARGEKHVTVDINVDAGGVMAGVSGLGVDISAAVETGFGTISLGV